MSETEKEMKNRVKSTNENAQQQRSSMIERSRNEVVHGTPTETRCKIQKIYKDFRAK